jgi:hypothetical protein
MRLHDTLTPKNFKFYCAKFYDNSQCYDFEEFEEDVRRIKYIKKAFSQYETSNEIKERLVLNHIIVLGNVFGSVVLPRLLFLRMDKQLKYLKPFLVYLGYCPKFVYNIGADNRNFDTDEIEMDEKLMNKLRNI